MMRKGFALLLALVLALTSCAALAEETEQTVSTTEIALLGRPVSEEPTHLTVGNTTKVSGGFFTELWSNNTSDIDVRTLIHGYSTVTWDTQVEFVTDPQVVQEVTTAAAAEGTRYTIKLWDDLCYNNGETKITAADYVFSLLLNASPQVTELGGVSTSCQHIVGYEDYHTGKTAYFSGVRLVDELTFSITVKAEYLPFFYELANIRVNPYPISVIAPGCAVEDSRDGAHFVNAEDPAAEAPFTAELLQQTLFDPETGYAAHPSLTCGPYTLASYDAESGQVEFALNPYYKGNFEGVKPVIDTLTLVPVQPETMIDQLQSGEVGLLNKCVDGQVILDGMALTADGFGMKNYARLGYGFCAFANEQGPTQFKAVRQAIAYSFDTASFVSDYLMDFGIPVYGYYGIGQWMTQAAMGTLRPADMTDAESAAWDELTLESLNTYEPDADEALALLVADGWTLNSKGEAFDPEKDTVRCKDVDGTLMPLTINFAKVTGNDGADRVLAQLQETLPKLGMELVVHEVSFTEMLADYYRVDGQRRYDMNFMATNFFSVFDPFFTFNSNPAIAGAINTTGSIHEQLMELAWDMHKTEPLDLLTYEQKWLAFQQCFNEELPTLPLYSNIYFDFHEGDLQNYDPQGQYSWPVAILYAYIGEPMETDDTPSFDEADGTLQVDGADDVVSFE